MWVALSDGWSTFYVVMKRAGGLFSFSSEPGKGSTFSVTLPMQSWGQEGIAAASEAKV